MMKSQEEAFSRTDAARCEILNLGDSRDSNVRCGSSWQIVHQVAPEHQERTMKQSGSSAC